MSDADAAFPRRVHPGAFAALTGGGLAWLATWFFPPTRGAWDALDMAVFRVLDASLDWGAPWTTVWAALNTREFDLFSAAFFAVVFLAWALPAERARVAGRLAAGGFVALYTAGVLGLSSHVIFGFERPSPTWAVEGARRLSEIVPWIEHKDWSGESFPGDHGTAVIMLTAMIWRIAGRRYGVVALAGACLFALPRLVSGAHWASDLLAGSVAVASVALGVALATPFGSLAVRAAEVPVAYVLGAAARAYYAIAPGERGA